MEEELRQYGREQDLPPWPPAVHSPSMEMMAKVLRFNERRARESRSRVPGRAVGWLKNPCVGARTAAVIGKRLN